MYLVGGEIRRRKKKKLLEIREKMGEKIVQNLWTQMPMLSHDVYAGTIAVLPLSPILLIFLSNWTC